jgi:hypothetical protein
MRRHIDLVRGLTRRLPGAGGLAAAAAAAGDPGPLLELEARDAPDALEAPEVLEAPEALDATAAPIRGHRTAAVTRRRPAVGV